MKKKTSKSYFVDKYFFFLFIGRLVEDMENKIRLTLNEIYFGKTRDIVNGLRSVQPLGSTRKMEEIQVF